MALFFLLFLFLQYITSSFSQATAPPPPPNATNIFNICTLDRPPMATCSEGVPSIEYSGLTLEIFRAAALDIGWAEGVEYRFICKPFTATELIADLAADGGECDAGAASITITSERQDLGVQFAYPYYSGAVGIMIKSSSSTTQGWAWIEPFSWDLWVAIGVTMLLWPAILFFLEVLSVKKRVKRTDIGKGVAEATWRSLYGLLHGATVEVSSFGARIAVIAFSFMALIIGSSYTANLAAFLTLNSANAIRSIYDLSGRGLAVATVPVYSQRLYSQYLVYATNVSISGLGDVNKTAELVARGSLAAFLYDDVIVNYAAATFPGCAVKLLPDRVIPFDFGIAFSKTTDPSIVAQMSGAILKLQEDGTVIRLEKNILFLDSPCLTAGKSVSSSTAQITLGSTYGLWVILISGTTLGIVIMVAVRLKNRHQWSEEGDSGSDEDDNHHGGRTENGVDQLGMMKPVRPSKRKIIRSECSLDSSVSHFV